MKVEWEVGESQHADQHIWIIVDGKRCGVMRRPESMIGMDRWGVASIHSNIHKAVGNRGDWAEDDAKAAVEAVIAERGLGGKIHGMS